MSVTCGFYNSLNGDRKYDAVQMSSIFDGIIVDGVFASIGTAFAVNAGEGFTVTVGIGKAWFNKTWTYNDSILPIEAPNSEVLLDRIDAIILEIDESEAVRNNDIKFIKGSPSSQPARPNLISETTLHQYPLCYIYRPAGSTEITQDQITNMVGSVDTPFITGILQTISLEELLGQWREELDNFIDNGQDDFTSWFDGIKDVIDESTAGTFLNMIEANTDEINRARDGIIYDCNCTYASNVYTLTINNAPISSAVMPDIYTVRFKTPNTFVEGSSFKIGSKPYTGSLTSSNDPLKAEFFASGKIVTAEIDEVGSTINFKGGGGEEKEDFSTYLFTSSATWIIPTGAKKIDVSCIGGGGRGGAGGTGSYSYGGGGGGSGYIQHFEDVPFSPGQQVSVTVGNGAGGYSQFMESSYRANGGSNGSTGSGTTGGAGGNGGAGGGGGGSSSESGGAGGNGVNTIGGAANGFTGGGGGSYGGSNGSTGSGNTGGEAGIPPLSNMWFIFEDPLMPVCLFARGGAGGTGRYGIINGGKTISSAYGLNNREIKNDSVLTFGEGGGGSGSGTTTTQLGKSGCVAVRVWW